MERRPPITLDEVGETILRLRTAGEKITARNIHARTGGSLSTVHKMLAEWLDLEEAEAAAPEISEDFLRVLKTGIGRAVKSSTESLSQSLNSARSQRDAGIATIMDLEGEKSELGNKAAGLDERIKALQTTVDSQTDRLTEMENANAILSEEKERLKQEVDRLTQECTAAVAREGAIQQMNKKLLDALTRTGTTPKRAK